MSTLTSSTAFERGIQPLIDLILPDKAEDILRFSPDPALQDRIDLLAAKCTEGDLTADERAEYEGYVRANKFIAIVQAQARRTLGQTP